MVVLIVFLFIFIIPAACGWGIWDVEKFQIVRCTGEMLPKFLRTGTPLGRDNLVVSEHKYTIFYFRIFDVWDNPIPIYLLGIRAPSLAILVGFLYFGISRFIWYQFIGIRAGFGYLLLVFWIYGCLFRFVWISVMVMFRTSVSDLYGFPTIFSFGILRSEVGDWTAMEHLQMAYRYNV